MRWNGQSIGVVDEDALPGMEHMNGFVRSITTPEFTGMTFHEVRAKSALNHVPGASAMPFEWTVNPYRGCSHACTYCFARHTHEYLELDSGHDFDTQIVVKVNVAEVLRSELARPTWTGETVMLGTNTDPYQRAEGRYRLMPGIIQALTDAATPFSILTKGTLVRRDLPLLAGAAREVDVSLAMSIAIFDDALQVLLEPGTPSTAARLDTVRAATDAGFRVTVFLMPILPHLTDSIAAIDNALSRIRTAGAHRVVFGALHLRPGAKQWFLQWLAREHPELVGSYRALYPGASAYAPKEYRAWLGKRVRPLLRVHGLDGRADDGSVTRPTVAEASKPQTGGRRLRSPTAPGLASTGAEASVLF